MPQLNGMTSVGLGLGLVTLPQVWNQLIVQDENKSEWADIFSVILMDKTLKLYEN